MLGLPHPSGAPWAAVGWDLAGILDDWCERLRHVQWALLLEPTPSRGRSLRNLTVNTFHPVDLLPETWRTHRFDWNPDDDEQREGRLADTHALAAFAEGIAGRWHDCLLEVGEEPADPLIRTARGDLSFSALLDAQRWHAAYHHRQLAAFLRGRGVILPGVRALPDVDLPGDVFG